LRGEVLSFAKAPPHAVIRFHRNPLVLHANSLVCASNTWLCAVNQLFKVENSSICCPQFRSYVSMTRLSFVQRVGSARENAKSILRLPAMQATDYNAFTRKSPPANRVAIERSRARILVMPTGNNLLTFPKPVYYRPPFPEETLRAAMTNPWLAAVPGEAAFTGVIPHVAIRRVGAVSEVAELIGSDAWADTRLERRNEITVRIAKRLQNRASEWNEHVQAFDQFIDKHVRSAAEDALDRVGLPRELMRFVKSDLVCYWQEINYRDIFQPGFYHSLWQLYSAGYSPCGWDESARTGVLLYR
jgi:hypothetical protein